jgi:signal peptidase
LGKHSGVSAIVKDIIIVVIGVAIIWFGLRIAFGTDNPFYVVSSGSMVPNLNVFDVLVVQGNDPFDKIQKGDIIVFNRPNGHDRVIVHRVAEIIDEDPRVVRTKGDANPASIPGTDMPITKDEYIGKVAYVIPQIGYVTRILAPPINYVIIAVIIGIMIYKQYGKNKTKSGKAVSTDQFTPTNSDVTETSIPTEVENFEDISQNNKNIESKKSEQKES